MRTASLSFTRALGGSRGEERRAVWMKCFRAVRCETSGRCLAENVCHSITLRCAGSFLEGFLVVDSAPFHPSFASTTRWERGWLFGGVSGTQSDFAKATGCRLSGGCAAAATVCCLSRSRALRTVLLLQKAVGLPEQELCPRTLPAAGRLAGGVHGLSACRRGLRLCPVSQQGLEACRDPTGCCWQQVTRSEMHSVVQRRLQVSLPALLRAQQAKQQRRFPGCDGAGSGASANVAGPGVLLAAFGLGGIGELPERAALRVVLTLCCGPAPSCGWDVRQPAGCRARGSCFSPPL